MCPHLSANYVLGCPSNMAQVSVWAGNLHKALYWEGNGFVLLYKRLESGSFQWPRNESEARMLTSQQYRWLMEGLSVDQPKAHKPVSGLEIL